MGAIEEIDDLGVHRPMERVTIEATRVSRALAGDDLQRSGKAGDEGLRSGKTRDDRRDHVQASI